MSDKLTFNEALKEINELSFTADNGESWVNSYTSVYALIQELKETYAPTIEMTQEAYNDLRHYRVHFPLDKFIYDFGELHGTQLSEKDLARAWLHPEIVEVKE